MDIVIDIFNYILAAILVGVSLTWIVLIKSMLRTFQDSPFLDKFEKKEHQKPKVSIILPARNEEKFIDKCLISLVNQDYTNYEIIAINDSSEDSTGDIIKKYAKKYPKVIPVDAKPKPEGWMGKNWACAEGYKKASGDLLLFTDADTTHTSSVITLAVSHLLSLELDALTVIPRMLCLDRITKITLPMISTFLHTRFSALRVNDTSKNTGYFFGSFYNALSIRPSPRCAAPTAGAGAWWRCGKGGSWRWNGRRVGSAGLSLVSSARRTLAPPTSGCVYTRHSASIVPDLRFRLSASMTRDAQMHGWVLAAGAGAGV